MIDTSGAIQTLFTPSSLYIDDEGYLFHAGEEKTGSVGLIKSPGLAEELHKKLAFDENEDIIAFDYIPIENSATKEALELLKKHNLLGNPEIFL